MFTYIYTYIYVCIHIYIYIVGTRGASTWANEKRGNQGKRHHLQCAHFCRGAAGNKESLQHTLQHTHCNTHTATHSLQHTHCNTHTATHSLQHTHCNTLTATHTLQHTHCNIPTATHSLQHTHHRCRNERVVGHDVAHLQRTHFCREVAGISTPTNEPCDSKTPRDQACCGNRFIKVHGIGKFLDLLNPHLTAHMFSDLANVSVNGHVWIKGQYLTGLTCTHAG